MVNSGRQRPVGVIIVNAPRAFLRICQNLSTVSMFLLEKHHEFPSSRNCLWRWPTCENCYLKLQLHLLDTPVPIPVESSPARQICHSAAVWCTQAGAVVGFRWGEREVSFYVVDIVSSAAIKKTVTHLRWPQFHVSLYRALRIQHADHRHSPYHGVLYAFSSKKKNVQSAPKKKSCNPADT
jgi:hypothetical protein